MKPTSPLKASESLTREIRQNKPKEPSKNAQPISSNHKGRNVIGWILKDIKVFHFYFYLVEILVNHKTI